jgi:serine/threonine-protein kinase
MKKITEITRRDLFDLIKYGFEDDLFKHIITYNGRLNEIEFLSRLYDLNNMRSNDSRYKNALGDIRQHTVNNDDWDANWVFSDERFMLIQGNDDDILLNFLCEIFHPFVRNESQSWREILKKVNELLLPDGYELYESSHISGRNVYSWRDISQNSIDIPIHNWDVSYDLKLVGEGSYAHVYKYYDEFYKRTFILKRAKKELSIKEVERFKQEFDQMKQLNSPYVVDVFCYNYVRNEYIMEYMDFTLDEYISQNNGKLTFTQRKNIANQVLRAIKYIHSKGLLHRDISPKNVLIKIYDDVRVSKVADFGLVKVPESNLTSISSELKGYFNDPELRLEGFSNYTILHETYAITRLLFFIMTGRTNTDKISNKSLKDFVHKGLSSDRQKRFQNIDEVIDAYNSVLE